MASTGVIKHSKSINDPRTMDVEVHADNLVGPYTDAEHMSLALVDSLICFEMPLFAIAHVGQTHLPKDHC